MATPVYLEKLMIYESDALLDDETLARQATANQEAFSTLYRRYLDRVYRYLLSRVGDAQEAQDLTALTFLAAWQGISRFQGEGVFAAWLFGIARRKAADYFRGNRATIPLEWVEDVSNDAPLPDAVVEQHLQMEQVARVLRGISPDRAEALALRVFGGLSAAETGQLMGKNEDAINMLVYRAMRDLRERLVSQIEVES